MPADAAAAVTVHRATPGDWARVRAIRLAALRDTPGAFWATAEEEGPQPEGWWRDRLADADRVTLLAVRADRDVGLTGIGPHHDDPGDAGAYAVWVDPAARGTGVADALIAAGIGWARERGYARLRLDVGDHNARAIGFYARAGFVPTGVVNTFPAPRQHITEHELALDLR